jgi:catechol 2,3-dioxygenase-like lactoylglutathione lyase family enzyme
MADRTIENTIPVLQVANLEKSIAFYGDLLGFDLEWNAGQTCSVARDGCALMLQQTESPSTSTAWIGLEGDSLIAHLEKHANDIVQPPTNQPWAYEMKIADLDGNILWFGAGPRK